MKRLRSMSTKKRRKIEQNPFFWSMHLNQMQEYLKPFALGIAPKQSKQKKQWKKRSIPISHPSPHRSIFDCTSIVPISARMALNTENRSITFRTNYVNEQTNKLFLDKTIPHELFLLMFEQLKIIKEWVNTERKCIQAFRSLVRLWLQRRYGTRLLNAEDPATLAEPIKPVLVFDYASRGLYCFELSTIKKDIESNLTYADWLDPEPLPPKNPFTNVPFTIGQLVKILHDLRVYGRNSWILESYRSSGMNERIFRNLFQAPLKIRVMQDKIKNQDSDFLELFDDFVDDEHDYHGLTSVTDTLTIKWAIRNETEHRLMQAWIGVFRNKHGVEVLHGMDEDVCDVYMRRIHNQTKRLFNDEINKHDMRDLGLKRFGVQSNVRVLRRTQRIAPTQWDELFPSSPYPSPPSPPLESPTLQPPTTQTPLPIQTPPAIIRTSIVPLETFPTPFNILVPIPPERLNRQFVNLVIDEAHTEEESSPSP